MIDSTKKPVAKKQSSLKKQKKTVDPNNDPRQLWVEVSAYFMSEARGFNPGHEQEDWTLAEQAYENSLSC